MGFRKRGRQVQEPERRDLNPSEVRNVRLLQYLFKLRAKETILMKITSFFLSEILNTVTN